MNSPKTITVCEDDHIVGNAKYSYWRDQLFMQRKKENKSVLDYAHHTYFDAIKGSLLVKDKDAKKIAVFHFTQLGICVILHGQEGSKMGFTVPYPDSECQVLFQANDPVFEKNYIPLFTRLTVRYHHQPERLAMELSLIIQEAEHAGHAALIPPHLLDRPKFDRNR